MRTMIHAPKAGPFWIVVALWLGASTAPAAARQAEAPSANDPSACRLKIHGESIEQLTFITRVNERREISQPGPEVWLPAGEHRLVVVVLEGGFACYLPPDEQDWFTLAPGKPHELTVGCPLPLTPTVRATRRGKLLRLDYQLLDAAGHNYSARDPAAEAPQFAIFKDGKEIGSGSFEYG